MNAKWMRQASLLLALILFLGCSADSSTLTRASVKTLIEKSKWFQPHKAEIYLTNEQFEAGERAGYFHRGRGFSENYFNLTPLGKQVFDIVLVVPSIVLKTKNNMRLRVIEVTGISSAEPGSVDRQVDFTWEFNLEDFPPALRPVFQGKLIKKGAAQVRKYDDGWRVVDFMSL